MKHYYILAMLLTSFISFSNFCVELLEFCVWYVMLSACNGNFTSSFPIWRSFIFCLIVVARTSDTMLNRNGETGHSSLIPEFNRKALKFSSLSIVLAMILIMLRYAPTIPTLVRVWSWMDIEFCQYIYHLLRWSCSFCLFFCWCGILHWLVHDEPYLWPWDESNLIMLYNIILLCCWIQFADILLRIFTSVLIKDINI